MFPEAVGAAAAAAAAAAVPALPATVESCGEGAVICAVGAW